MNLDQAKEIITQHAPKELPSPYWFNFGNIITHEGRSKFMDYEPVAKYLYKVATAIDDLSEKQSLGLDCTLDGNDSFTWDAGVSLIKKAINTLTDQENENGLEFYDNFSDPLQALLEDVLDGTDSLSTDMPPVLCSLTSVLLDSCFDNPRNEDILEELQGIRYSAKERPICEAEWVFLDLVAYEVDFDIPFGKQVETMICEILEIKTQKL